MRSLIVVASRICHLLFNSIKEMNEPWLVGCWLGCWLAGLLAWLVGWLVGWLAGWLVGGLFGWLVGVIDLLNWSSSFGRVLMDL